MKAKPFKYSLQFWRLCFSSYLFFVSFNLIIPELPSYLTSLGGEDYKGLIIGLFTIAAFISRPFSGRLADTVGRMPIIAIGTGVCIIMGALYPFVIGVFGFLVIRFLHGFSTGFQPTGTTAFIADIVPFDRRGEAMGYIGVAGSLGMASGPWFGTQIAKYYSIDHAFFASAIAGLLSLVVLIGIRETLPKTIRFQWKHLAVWNGPMVDKLVWPATFVMILTTFSFGLLLTISPDFSDYLMVDRGMFFLLFTFASIVSRLIAGKLSDIYGRVPVLLVAVLIHLISMVIIGYSTTPTLFYIGSIAFGLGGGMLTPTLFAWTVDLGNSASRAVSIATVYMGMESGIFLGAVVSSLVYSNNADNFQITFLSAAFLSAVALLYLIWYRRKHA